MLSANSVRLGDIVDIKNGVQTSKNSIFVIKNFTYAGPLVRFKKAGVDWEIERAITRPYVDDSGQVSNFCNVAGDALVVFPYEALAGAAPSVVLHAVQHLRKAMDLLS